MILITGEEKELETTSALANAGAAIDLGLFGNDGVERVKASVARLIDGEAERTAMTLAARQTIDGLGGLRIAKAIQAVLEGRNE